MTRLPLDALISAQREAQAISTNCMLARHLGAIDGSPKADREAAQAEARVHSYFARLAAGHNDPRGLAQSIIDKLEQPQ
jgi:hypothetical protein